MQSESSNKRRRWGKLLPRRLLAGTRGPLSASTSAAARVGLVERRLERGDDLGDGEGKQPPVGHGAVFAVTEWRAGSRTH